MTFEVGDEVVRIGHDFNAFKVGDIAIVVKLDTNENIFVSNDKIKAETIGKTTNKVEDAYGVYPSYIRKATKLEKALK